MWLAAMAEKKQNVKRLAKGLRAKQKRTRTGRARKDSLRAESGSDARRTLENERDLSPFFRLAWMLRAEKIRCQLIGMSGAVLQGVPVVTHDVYLWIDLSPREYMRPIVFALRDSISM